MKIYNPTGFSSNLTGSFSGSVKGVFDGSFTSTATTEISGAFDSVSSSLSSRVTSQETFSSSLDNTFATDADLNIVSASVDALNAATSSYALENSISGSFTSTSQSLASELLKNTTDTLTGDLTVTGTITAQEFHTEFVSASILFDSGSTKFGDTSDDNHDFTGSLKVSSSIYTTSQTFTPQDTTINSTNTSINSTNITVGNNTSDNVYVGDSTLNVLGGKVGIGTTTLNALLTISGSTNQNSTNPGISLTNSDNSQTVLFLENTTTRGYELAVGGSSNSVDPGSFYVYDATATLARFIINSSGNVGIGQAPSSFANWRIFEIKGLSNGSLLNFEDSGSTRTGAIAMNDASSLMRFQTFTDADITFEPNNSEAMRVTGDGKVGIGTNNPDVNRRLHIKNTDDVRGILIENDFSGSYAELHLSASREYRVGTGGSASDSDAQDNFYIYDRTAAQHRITLNSSGEVGIGTSSPDGQLTVKGTTQTVTLDLNANLEVGLSIMGLPYTNQVGITIGKANSTKNSGVLRYHHNTDGGNDNYVGIGHYAADDILNITSGGNVGIGTTSPFSTAKLQVKTDTDRNVAIQTGTTHTTGIKINAFNDAANTNIPLELNGSLLSLKTGETEKIRILANGNVGIGTDSPSQELDVVGIIKSSGVSNSLMFSDRATAANTWEWYSSGNNAGLYKNHNTAGTVMTIDSSGNVGIGTTNPSGKLDIQQDTTGDLLTRVWNTNTSGTGDSILRIANSGNNANGNRIEFSDANYYTATISGDRSQGIMLRTSGTGTNPSTIPVRLQITPSGIVNIRAADDTPNSTQFALAIKGYGNRTAYFDGDSIASVWWGVANTPHFAIDSVNGGGATFWTHVSGTWYERMRIEDQGDIGIGTNAPSAKLDIVMPNSNGATRQDILRLLQDGQNTLSCYMYGGTTDLVQLHVSGTEQNLSLTTGGVATATTATGIHLRSGGDVGIGIVNPSATLHVQTNSTADLKVITTGAADASVKIQGYDAGVHIGDATNGLRWAVWNDGPSTSSSLKFGSYALGTWYSDASQVVTMESSGHVGIGTTNPAPKLHLVYSGGSYGTDATSGFINQATTGRATQRIRSITDNPAELFFDIDGGIRWDISVRDSSGNYKMNFYPQGATVGYANVSSPTLQLEQDGDVYMPVGNVGIGVTTTSYKLEVNGSFAATSITETSALKFKENITPLSSQLEIINKLNPVNFDWKEDGKKDFGFIADEVEEIIPELVSYKDDEVHGLHYSKLTPILVKALQEQQTQIEELKQEIKKLKEI
jgi:hypothetical protein